jgi:tetratricopeptide (TPR) repeat protein
MSEAVSAVTDEPTVTNPQAEAQSVRALLDRGQHAAAEAAARSALERFPGQRDLLYMLAVALRFQRRTGDALLTLARLEEEHPEYPRLFQERGHCLVAQRAAPQAAAAFERAVALNPALPGSWRALEPLYRLLGRNGDAENAAAHVVKLASLPTAVVTATSMFFDGELELAERTVREFLLAHGDHIEAMRLLARIGMKHDILDDAELLLENVLRLAPDYHLARYDYAQVLVERHKHLQARAELEKLLALDPKNVGYQETYATVCAGLGEHEHAITLYRRLLQELPRDAPLHLSVAHSLKTLGRREEAIEAYRAAARARADYGDAYWSLANLKTYRFTDEELAAMQAAQEARRLAPVDRYHLCFALGKAYEDRGEYATSYAWYEKGNALKHAEVRYRPQLTERNARLQMQTCTREFFAARAGYGSDSRAPIFIVGLPRSGSTLIEQILASHSQVEGTMELSDVPRLVGELRGREKQQQESRYPALLAELTAEDFRRFGERYLKDTSAYRAGRPRFIDKMPNNFRHLGLVHLMFPNATIIDARREPMACCFSNFKQLFASGQEFTYSIEDLARYYRTYVDLMAHWEHALPGRVLRVQHEELVADFEPQVRRLLDFAGLEFEPACLEFWRNERSVRTASSEQVRQPLNRDGIDQWRNFEPWLGSLKSALGELVAP